MRRISKEEEESVCTTLGVYQEYPEENLKEMLKDDAFWLMSQKIHKNRCDADLMYAILFGPEIIITMANGTRIKLIDRILGAFLNIVAKKNAPSYGKLRRIRESETFLKSDKACTIIKTFNVLIMLSREHELQDVVRSGMNAEDPHNLFGSECLQHFDEYLKHLHKMVEMTYNWPYNEVNVVDVVRNFVYTARSHYTGT